MLWPLKTNQIQITGEIKMHKILNARIFIFFTKIIKFLIINRLVKSAAPKRENQLDPNDEQKIFEINERIKLLKEHSPQQKVISIYTIKQKFRRESDLPSSIQNIMLHFRSIGRNIIIQRSSFGRDHVIMNIADHQSE